MVMTTENRSAAAVAATMTSRDHAAATAIAAAFGHDKTTLADDPDLLAQYLQAGKDAVAAALKATWKEVGDEIAELLSDLDHENCDDDGCTGGGMQWYQRVGKRLADPYGAVTHIARRVEWFDDEPDYAHCHQDGWLWHVQDRVAGAEESAHHGVRRALLLDAAAFAALEVDRLDREEDAQRRSSRAETAGV
jgi:hypothetical protein